MITLKDITKIYPKDNDKKIFSNFSLEIKKGEKIGLLGPNGCGKTTLLNIISSVEKKFSGTVKLSSHRIGYVHQYFYSTLANWFTAEKNILIFRKYNHLDVEKGRLLLDDLTKELKINFSLKKYPFALSGGQRQMVALLRALVLEPDIFLLDEPFSAIDTKRRLNVIKILKKHLRGDTTCIITSQRGDEIKSIIDKVLILDKRAGGSANIFKEISCDDFNSRKKFEKAILKISSKIYEEKSYGEVV